MSRLSTSDPTRIVHLPPELFQRLEAEAHSQRRDVDRLAEIAVATYLLEIERLPAEFHKRAWEQR